LRDDGVEPGEIEHMPYGWTRSSEQEPATGLLDHGGVSTYQEADSHGSDGADVLKVSQNARASHALDFIELGLHVFHFPAGNEWPVAAKDADVVALFDFYQHRFAHRQALLAPH